MIDNTFKKAVAAGAFSILVPALLLGQLLPKDRAQIRARKQQRIQAAQQELIRRGPELGFGVQDTFQPKATMTDERGRVHVRFARYHQGVRVLRGGVKVAAGDLEATVTQPNRRDLNLASVVPAISEGEAKEIIARDLKLLPAKMEFLSELVIDPPGKDGAGARLAWLIRADAEDIVAQRYFIDATNGTILRKTRAHVSGGEIPAGGTGYPFHRSMKTLTTFFVDSEGKYILQDPTRGMTFVYDVEDKKPNWSFHGNHYYDDNNAWGDGQDWKFGNSTTGPTGQTAAVDAFYGARVTWDLLLNVFQHDGWADDGGPMRLRVHFREKKDQPYGDANFDGYFANFGDGSTSDDPNEADPATVAHELGHGVWHAVVSEEFYGENDHVEAKGLNEGHGDIVAALARHYETLAQAQGATVPTAPYGDVSLFRWRSINPWMYVASGGHVGLSAYPHPGGPSMGEHEEHTQGTVYGRMFAILAAGSPSTAEYAQGDPCPNARTGAFQCLVSGQLPQGMAGIGMHDAGRLWYRATAEFSEEPTFHSAREAYLTAATDIFGEGSPQYKSVMNAFRAVNIGDEAVDTGNPSVALSDPVVDNFEESVYIEATGWDDIGVRSLRLATGGNTKNAPGGVFKGYLDLSGGTLGQRTIDVTAFDALGKEGQASTSAKYKGGNFVIDNRGFENTGKWVTSGPLFKNWSKGAFLGKGYVSFSGSSWIRQQFQAPEAATSCTIGYRVRVNPGGNPSGLLRVDVMQPNGIAIQQFVNMILANTDTTDPTSNNYKAFKHVVNGCNGKELWIRFKSEGASEDGFRVDNAYVVYTAPVNATFEAEADATEGSVILQVKNIQNVQWTQIKEVRFTGGAGETLVKQHGPYIVIRPTSEFATGAPYNVSAAIMDWADDPMKILGPEQFVVPNVTQLVKNGGFDSGMVWWTQSGSALACGNNPAGGEGPEAFLGLGCVYFEGTGWLEQEVSIPAGGGTAKMSFRLKIEQGSANDKLRVTVEDVAVGPAVKLGEIIGDTNTKEGVSHMNYQKVSYDLTPYKGKTVRIRFSAVQGATPMLYFIDNVGASYKGPLVIF